MQRLHCLSSKATGRLLLALAQDFDPDSPDRAWVESIGGVDAAACVRAGQALDVVVLAADVIDALIREGHLVGPRFDVVRSATVVAVRTGLPHPSIATPQALRRAVESARAIAFSTGPSGVALTRLFETWGIAGTIADRLVQAPAGVPVGQLLADGQADLGFQQHSELIHVPGIDILGPMPAEIEIVTTFAAAQSVFSPDPGRAQAFLAMLVADSADALKIREGMEPVGTSAG